MKITDVTATLFAWDGIPAATYSERAAPSQRSELALVAVATDQGVTGHAFLGSSFRSAVLDVASLVRTLKPVLLGQDPLERERLHRALMMRQRSTTLRAIGALDVALWDIAGKVAGLPIHALIGTHRRKIRAYASSSHLPRLEDYVAQWESLRARGFTAYKIHPPFDAAATVPICHHMRKLVGDATPLMIDPACSLDYPAALRLGLVVQDLGFHWYEDPLSDQDIYNCAKLRQQLRIPLMATEMTPGGFGAFAAWISAGATDYLRGDAAVKGGITPLVKAAHLAEAFRMNFELHHGGNSLNNVANVHVAMAIANTEFFEILLPDAGHKYGLAKDIEVDAEGYVHAIDGPGLGAEIDFDLVRAKTIEVLR
ncbi:MAG: enolase C-terminal domain-like protein [Alphaproteobacteria bacterium]